MVTGLLGLSSMNNCGLAPIPWIPPSPSRRRVDGGDWGKEGGLVPEYWKDDGTSGD